MELDLKSFSLTLAVGVVVVAVLLITLWVVDQRRLRGLLQLFDKKDGFAVLPSVMTAVLLLAIGFVCEDLSKNAINGRSPSALSSQLSALLPTEGVARCTALLNDERTQDAIERRDPRRSCFISTPAVSAPLTDLGHGSLRMLDELVRKHVATVEEVRVHDQLIKNHLPSRPCASGVGKATDAQEPQCVFYGQRTSKQIEQFYYLAKNTAYTDSNFFSELEAIRSRFDFERSVCFVLISGIFAVSFAYLVRSTQNMWRDVGGWKMVVSLLLTALLVFALWDVVATAEWTLNAPQRALMFCASQLDPPPAGTLLPSEHAREACKSTIQTGRDWALPVAFLFVCAYRLRRVGVRAWASITRSVLSTVPGPTLLKHAREHEAARALIAVGALAAAIIPVYYAYEADQINYHNRVFAYYISVRSPMLECGAEGSCWPAGGKSNGGPNPTSQAANE